MNELMNRGLPKWPQMIVTGTTLPVGQALEIIRRTDNFFSWADGNNHKFIETAKKAIGYPVEPKERDFPDREAFRAELRSYWDKEKQWKDAWGVISTEYVENDWISCAFIGGPHGWCHPDGTIGYVNNVGKWPSVEEIYNEWGILAAAFPFIEVEVTLMDGEEYEENTKPVVSMLVRNGKVELVDPAKRDLHKEFNRTIMPSIDRLESIKGLLCGVERENAISIEQLKLWGSQHPFNLQENSYAEE